MTAAVIDETFLERFMASWHPLVMHAQFCGRRGQADLPVVEAHELPGSNLLHQDGVRHNDVWPGTQKDLADGAKAFWQVLEQVVVQTMWWSLQQANSTHFLNLL